MHNIPLSEIHDDTFENEIIKLIEVDIRQLVKEKERFKYAVCPVCEHDDSFIEYDIFGLNYCRCKICRTIYLNPCPPEELIVWYLNNGKASKKWREGMPIDVIEKRKNSLYRSRVDYILEQIKTNQIKTKNIIDIGGGNGEFIEELWLRKFFEKIYIIEPQELNIDLNGVEVIRTTFENYFPQEKVDVIVAFEVLEHIINPNIFLKKVYQCLNDEGIFIFSTPNIDGFETSTLGKVSRACWFDHVRLYNPHSIEKLLHKNNMKKIKLETPGELDVQIIANEYHKGNFDTENNTALKFILESNDLCRSLFQNYLVKNNLSSHMRCVARKKKL